MTDQTRAKKLLARRADPPTAIGSLLAQARVRVPIAVAIGLMVWLCVSQDLMEVAFLVVGLWVGALLRDLRYAFEVQRVWPCIERMFDWAKIEEMAGDK